MSTYTPGDNMQQLINELKLNNDFNYLFNYDYKFLNYRNSGFGVLSSHWHNADDFIYNFCTNTPYFPYSLFNDTKTLTKDELAETKNYIICTLFIAACIEKFLDKYMGNVTDCQDKFNNFAVVDFKNNKIDTQYISFELVDRHIPYIVEIKVNMPAFTADEYEYFNAIKDFLNSDSVFEIDINGVNRGSVDTQIVFTAESWKKFTHFLEHILIEFRKYNGI